jgi:hypothetical protein
MGINLRTRLPHLDIRASSMIVIDRAISQAQVGLPHLRFYSRQSMQFQLISSKLQYQLDFLQSA